MYLSFMLATFQNGKKNSFLNKCEKKTMKKTVIAIKKCTVYHFRILQGFENSKIVWYRHIFHKLLIKKINSSIFRYMILSLHK